MVQQQHQQQPRIYHSALQSLVDSILELQLLRRLCQVSVSLRQLHKPPQVSASGLQLRLFSLNSKLPLQHSEHLRHNQRSVFRIRLFPLSELLNLSNSNRQPSDRSQQLSELHKQRASPPTQSSHYLSHRKRRLQPSQQQEDSRLVHQLLLRLRRPLWDSQRPLLQQLSQPALDLDSGWRPLRPQPQWLH